MKTIPLLLLPGIHLNVHCLNETTKISERKLYLSTTNLNHRPPNFLSGVTLGLPPGGTGIFPLFLGAGMFSLHITKPLYYTVFCIDHKNTS